MRFEEVRQALQRRPFQPIMVRMISGTEYRVTTPESIVSPRFAAFLVKGGLIETVALEFIEAIRPLQAAGNGRRSRAARKK
ncbi:MAG: hypothetical protein HYZ53_03235 [Planctomycetes bacterium]|nr:hypothetical protein [Planctomycetota bacterium]